jgi:thioredoxin reductase (NADPH)
MEEIDLVIIGAGPTGLFATFCAGLREVKSITLESMEAYGGQIPTLYPEKIVYDVQGIPRIRAQELADKMYEQAQLFHNTIKFGANVTDIVQTEDKNFIIEVNNEQAYKCKAVLLCSGIGHFVPTKLGAEGEAEYADKGVSYAVKSSADFKDKKVAIVGGGDSAFDYANMIAPAAALVIIMQHNESLKAAESSIENAKKSGKITIMLNTEVKKVIGDGVKVTKLHLFNNKENTESDIDADALVVAIGHKASPNAFKSVKLELVNRYVKVNGEYKTNIEGIFAAGDVANISDQPKFALIAVGGAEAYSAINNVKKYITPQASLFGGHSSSLDL